MATSLKPSRSMSPVSSTAIPNRPVTDDGESREVKPPNCSKREDRKERREEEKREEEGERVEREGERREGTKGLREKEKKNIKYVLNHNTAFCLCTSW